MKQIVIAALREHEFGEAADVLDEHLDYPAIRVEGRLSTLLHASYINGLNRALMEACAFFNATNPELAAIILEKGMGIIQHIDDHPDQPIPQMILGE